MRHARPFSAESVKAKIARLPKLKPPKQKPKPVAKKTPTKRPRKRRKKPLSPAVSARRHALRVKYGLSETAYNNLLKAQGGVCAICGQKETTKNRKRLAVDHCHDTNTVRGLLCLKCNVMLGQARDDLRILENAINYLKKVLDKSN